MLGQDSTSVGSLRGVGGASKDAACGPLHFDINMNRELRAADAVRTPLLRGPQPHPDRGPEFQQAPQRGQGGKQGEKVISTRRPEAWEREGWEAGLLLAGNRQVHALLSKLSRKFNKTGDSAMTCICHRKDPDITRSPEPVRPLELNQESWMRVEGQGRGAGPEAGEKARGAAGRG